MASLQSIRNIHRKARPLTRQRRREEKQNKKCAPRSVADGFLNQEFIPVTLFDLPSPSEIAEIEKEFFTSLQYLADMYGFAMPDVSTNVFPVNIHFAYQYAENKLEQRDGELHLLVIRDETHKATLATARTLDSGLTLYYVPVEPLYRLICNKQNKQVKELLLSVFTYLRLVALMPLSITSYVSYTYDMIEEWIQSEPEEWDDEEYKGRLAELRAIKKGMKRVIKDTSNLTHLNSFKRRLENLIPADNVELFLLQTADRLYSLWESFPNSSFHDNLRSNLMYPEKEDRIVLEEYFSFYWSDEGWLYEDLIDNVNNSLQEKDMCEDPVAVQLFDQPQKTPTHTLAYETELLDIISDLADALNEI